MATKILSTQKRVFQYWFSDGLAELSLGLVCVLLGLYLLAQALLPQDSLASRLLNLLSVFIVFGMSVTARQLLNAAKSRITYPRTGYVAYQRPGKLEYLAVGVVCLFFIAMGTGLLAFPQGSLAWMPVAAGIVFGAVLLFQALRSGLPRLFVLALVSLMLGGGLALSGIPNLPGLAYFFILSGPCFIVSGWTGYHRYQRSTRVDQAGSA